MRRLGEHDLRFGDAAFGSRSLAGGEDTAQDRFGPTAREEPRDVVVAVEQARRPPDGVGLDTTERRERLGVERVLVEVHRGRRLGHGMDRWPAVVDEPERPAIAPAHVVGPPGRELLDHVVDRPSTPRKRIHRAQCGPGRGARRSAPTLGRMQLSDLRIFTEPQQGATYDDLLAVAVRAEYLGFGAFFRSDHYLAMGERIGSARTDRRMDHARRPRPGHLDDPPRHPRHVGHVPTARPLRRERRPGRPDVRRTGRARARGRLVRRRTPGLRDPLPGARRALRPAGGATRDHHGHVGDARRGDVRFARRPLPDHRFTGADQAAADAVADRDRRRRSQTHAGTGGPFRRGVQHTVRRHRLLRPAVRPGARRLRVDRPRPRDA